MLLTQCEYGLDDPDGADKDSHQSITVNLSGVSSSGDEVKEATSVRVYLVPDHESAAADESGQGAHGGGSRRGPGDTAF